LEKRWRNGARPFARFIRKFLTQRRLDAKKKTRSGKAVGSTRLRRVVSGVTPETVCGHRLLSFVRSRQSYACWAIRRDAELNPRDAGATVLFLRRNAFVLQAFFR
jgi:hypothetical protein